MLQIRRVNIELKSQIGFGWISTVLGEKFIVVYRNLFAKCGMPVNDWQNTLHCCSASVRLPFRIPERRGNP